MENAHRQFGTPEWLVLIGASVFILVLAVSAFFEADIRWLHFFQAWMYIVTIALSSSGQPLGIFRRDFRCRLLGLCQCFCNHLLLQRARRAISLGPYRTSGAPGSFYRGSGVVLQFVGDNWVRVGVFTEANKTPKRHHQGSGFLHAHHAFFRRRHGFVPAALPRHLSPIVTPAPSLGGSLTLLLPLGVR